MGKITKLAVATAIGSVAMGSAAAPDVLGEPLPAPSHVAPTAGEHGGASTSNPVGGNHLPLAPPLHFFPTGFLNPASTPKPRLLVLEKSTPVNTSLTFTPMEHSPLAGIPLIATSVTLSPHGDAHSWEVNPRGTITFTPGENFLGEARASYSVEDTSGTIFTSSISVHVP